MKNVTNDALDLCDLAPSYIRSVAHFQPGKPIAALAREFGLEPDRIVNLVSNENPLGSSPLAIRAIRAVIDGAARYPDGNGFELKQALSKRYGVDKTQIVLGNGSNDVLSVVARTFLTSASEALCSQYAFSIFKLEIQYTGAKCVEAPAHDFAHDVNAMLAAITPRTRMIFLANPNNPTGTLIGGNELHKFLGQVPQHVIVVLDEAYNEYIPEALSYDSVEWLTEFPNLIITRTFSKAYGLAGLRVGYAFAHPAIADLMNRVRQPFNANSFALAAAAASLEDHEFVRHTFEVNRAGMRQLTMGLTKLGLSHIPSAANFVTFKVDDGARVYQRLVRRGVIVRLLSAYKMPEYLRAGIGLKPENARFLDALAHSIPE